MSSETYEIWVLKAAGTWHQILEGDDPVFSRKKRAYAVAGSVSQKEDTVEVKVVERCEVLSLNGPALLDEKPTSPRVKSRKEG